LQYLLTFVISHSVPKGGEVPRLVAVEGQVNEDGR